MRDQENSDPARTSGGELIFERLLAGLYRFSAVTCRQRRIARKGEMWCEGRW
ncbi:MAG: hypothetical protein ACR2GU_02500 [Rubrobacteraceae bacterium]